jgi:tetratricopeptide (TPR) repeat protein
MAATHYETLKVSREASAADIKSAYRKIALQHHPDKSSDPASKSIFIAATEAYDVLVDADQKAAYDEKLRREAAQREEKLRKMAAPKPQSSTTTGPAATSPATTTSATKPANPPRQGWATEVNLSTNLAMELQKLTSYYSRGNHVEADKLARQISRDHPRNPVPYAVLGDIARQNGNINEAARMYAYAAQFEPNNPIYQRRYEELLTKSQVVESRGQHTQLAPGEHNLLGPYVGGLILLLGGIYLGFSHEAGFGPRFGPFGTWTPGLLVTLSITGLAIGFSLSMGNLLDRFESVSSSATGKSGPLVWLTGVAILNFWLAALAYLVLALTRRSGNISATRFFGSVGLAVIVLALAGALFGHVDFGSVMLWGGNLFYLIGLLGWIVGDSVGRR